MRFKVTFSQYSIYEVEANSKSEAIDSAYKEFKT